MTKAIQENCIDNHVDDEIYDCLNLDNPKSFFLFAGAGSGKTRSLVNVLTKIHKENAQRFRLSRQQIAIITYTNAACDEIKHRLDNNSLFSVSTIHSFIWELIKSYPLDIKTWLRSNITTEIALLKEQQLKGRSGTKAATDRERKISSKSKRLENLDNIKRFTYNPNGDNRSIYSLNHSEVIKIGSDFLMQKSLMQKILVKKYPILLIDESQDTKKELIDAFFEVQKTHASYFSLGIFGDTMQRIYSDGKDNIEKNLPDDWLKPEKKMNHRSSKRIISLINKIRKDVDQHQQLARSDKEEGFVRLFIVSSEGSDKKQIENLTSNKMATVTKDSLWFGSDANIKTLTLEHHMAASRMGFLEFYKPLYKTEKYKTGLLDGTLSGIRFFTHQILPLIKAKQNNDEFLVSKIIRQHSSLFKPSNIKKKSNQLDVIKLANAAVNNLFSLWDENNDPRIIDTLQNVAHSELFEIPESLIAIAYRTKEEQKISESLDSPQSQDQDELINAWDESLSSSFSQIEYYNDYMSDNPKFGTHQGVKGLEFERVMVILDDVEAKGFLFSYEKLFGSKKQTPADIKKIDEGKETSIDRTRRLFYVTCSRAEKSLAIVAYTVNPSLVRSNVLKNGWFKEDEIEIID